MGDGGHKYDDGGLEYGDAWQRRRRARVAWWARLRRRICIYVTREGNERVISSTAMTSNDSYNEIRVSGLGRKTQDFPKKV
jgi:hypothetical protein